MTSYAAYVKPGRAPVLVADRFSFWAFVFGPLWLLVHAAWIPAVLLLALYGVLGAVVHGPAAAVLGWGVAWLVGLHGQDWRGWSLARRGWRLDGIVSAGDVDAATVRLLDVRAALSAAA